MDFENKKDKKNGIYYSRYIASWTNVAGDYFGEEFTDWLKSVGVDENEASQIRWMAECGKMELEMSVARYLAKKGKVKLSLVMKQDGIGLLVTEA